MNTCVEELRKAAERARRIGKLAEHDYVTLIEWSHVKRLLAEAAAKCVRSMLGDESLEIYFADFSGGERAETTGRDVDLIIVVDDRYVDDIRARVEEMLNKLIDALAPELRRIVGGKNVFEIHVVGKSSPQLHSLVKARFSPPIKL